MRPGDKRRTFCWQPKPFIPSAMKILKYSLGIDMASKTMQCCLASMDRSQIVTTIATRSFPNTPSGFSHLEKWINKYYSHEEYPLGIILEATGVYYEACALYLHKAGYRVSVVLPNKSKKYMQSLGLRSKTDSIDARGLARMGAQQRLAVWQPLSEFYFTLRTLTRHLQSLQQTRNSLSNQLHALQVSIYEVPMATDQLRVLLECLEEQVGKAERAIRDHIGSNESVAEKVDQLCSIKGVGLLTVAVILAETNGVGLISHARQLVSYAGYDVVENQSGKRSGATRISKKGNHRIRRILHFPTINVVKFQGGVFADLFERTYRKHHIKMKSYVAVQKKLLIILYTLWRKDQPFIEQPVVTGREEG